MNLLAANHPGPGTVDFLDQKPAAAAAAVNHQIGWLAAGFFPAKCGEAKGKGTMSSVDAFAAFPGTASILGTNLAFLHASFAWSISSMLREMRREKRRAH